MPLEFRTSEQPNKRQLNGAENIDIDRSVLTILMTHPTMKLAAKTTIGLALSLALSMQAQTNAPDARI